MKNVVDLRIAELQFLHPTFRPQVERILRNLDELFVRSETPLRWGLFETYRGLERQNALFLRGASRALPWRSAHQYGLAADIVPMVDGKWFWPVEDDAWTVLRAAAMRAGADCPIAWDKAHVESKLWPKLHAVMF